MEKAVSKIHSEFTEPETLGKVFARWNTLKMQLQLSRPWVLCDRFPSWSIPLPLLSPSTNRQAANFRFHHENAFQFVILLLNSKTALNILYLWNWPSSLTCIFAPEKHNNRTKTQKHKDSRLMTEFEICNCCIHVTGRYLSSSCNVEWMNEWTKEWVCMHCCVLTQTMADTRWDICGQRARGVSQAKLQGAAN